MLVGLYGESVKVISFTKKAASIVNGATAHSFFGLQREEFVDHESIVKSLEANRPEQFKFISFHLKILFIDEVNMLTCSDLSCIDNILRMLKRNNDEPFGGVQVVLIGDVLQLPPFRKTSKKSGVVNGRYFTKEQLNKMMPLYFFETTAFTEGNFFVAYLEKVHRQTNKDYIELLNRIRLGEQTAKDIHTLNALIGGRIPREYFNFMNVLIDELNASELIHKIPLPKLQLLTIKKRSESYEQFIFN
jgi:hypothetical protein